VLHHVSPGCIAFPEVALDMHLNQPWVLAPVAGEFL
jgi:hypothetical protein